jgi:hypothetical protein
MIANLAQDAIGADDNGFALDDAGIQARASAQDVVGAPNHRPHREALQIKKGAKDLNRQGRQARQEESQNVNTRVRSFKRT